MGKASRERAFRLLLRLFPRDFRDLRGAELERLFGDMVREREEEKGRLGPRFWTVLIWNTAIEALGEWLSLAHWTVRSTLSRSLGEQMSTLVGDVRYAFRQLVRNPLYGFMIVLLMTLGIAGNAAVFRVFNGLFLRPLSVDRPEQLVDLDETAPQWDLEFVGIAYPDYVAWRDANETFQSMAAFTPGGGNFVDGGEAARVRYLRATHTIDEVLGLAAHTGRFFGPEEDHPDGPRAMLLTRGFWEQKYGADPDVLGRTVSVNGYPVEIIGVLPPEARFVSDADVWMPLRQGVEENTGWFLSGLGRLKPGVTPDQAQADLTGIHKGLVERRDVNEITSPVVNSLRDRYLGDYRLGSWFLLAAVGVVLLIACANIAGLMVARSIARGPEMAVRLAMGAPRLRIARQVVTESLVLAVLGSAAGTALGVWGSSALVAALADQFPNWITFDLDWRFLVFTLLVTTMAAVLFGLAPAVQASASRAPVSGAQHATRSASRKRAMALLVTGEVALATVLLVIGGLTVLDVSRLGRVDPGFDAERLISYQLTLPSVRYEGDDARLAFVQEYLPLLDAIPGVESAAVASSLPLSGHWGWFFVVDGAPPRAEDEGNPVVLNRVVTPGYFETLGVRFAAGRPFNELDGREGNEAIIVNETFVRTHLSHLADPIGARVWPGTDQPDQGDPWYTVVGVTRDVKHYGVDERMRPGVYQPLRQFALGGFTVALRVRSEAAAIVAAARAVTAEMDVELPVYNVRTMTEELDDALFTRRATSWVIGAFASVALLLAMAGIYGVISYSVGQRTQEISIHMAMGARQDQVLGQILKQGMVLVGAGLVLGVALSISGAGVVSGLLVGVNARDPLVYLGVTALLAGVAVLANYLPARRAAGLDPMQALRGE